MLEAIDFRHWFPSKANIAIFILLAVFSFSVSLPAQEERDSINTATVTAWRPLPKKGAGLVSFGMGDFRPSAAFGTPDILRMITETPGVAMGSEMSSNYHVHGGDGSDNLFVLNGVPLFNVGHIGGFISTFNTEAVKDADFFKSGIPARYGGKLSSVLDVKTFDGDLFSYKGGFSISPTDLSVHHSGPLKKGKTSYNAAFRISPTPLYMNSLASLIYGNNVSQTIRKVLGGSISCGFGDLNIGIAHHLDNGDKINVNLFAGVDYAGHSVHKSYEAHTGEDDKQAMYYLHKVTNAFFPSWQNAALSSDWRKTFGSGLTSTVSAYISFAGSSFADQQGEEVYLVNPEKKERTLTDSRSVDNSSSNRIFDFAAKSHWSWKNADFSQLTGGVEFRGMSLGRFSKVEDVFIRQVVFAPSIFAEEELKLLNGLFAFNIGARYEAFLSREGCFNSLDPRISLSVHPGVHSSITASFSRTHQFVQRIGSMNVDLPMSFWVGPSDRCLSPSSSHEVALGYCFNLPGKLVITLEGYYKKMFNLCEYAGAYGNTMPMLTHWEEGLHQGEGRAMGAEFGLSYNSEKLDIDLSYTISKSERYFPTLYPDWFPDRYDNRHNFFVKIAHRANEWLYGFISWAYHSGNRISVPEVYYVDDASPGLPTGNWKHTFLYGKPYNYVLPDYHRLDIGAEVKSYTRKGHLQTLGFSVYNVYNRKNPVVVSFHNPLQRKGQVFLEATSYFPILPSVRYTLYF